MLKCFGNVTQRRITIQLEVLNHNDRILNGQVSFNSAFTLDGEECDNKKSLTDARWWANTKMPSQVKIKQDYFVLDVTKKIPGFSYLEFEIRDAKVIIRNLPVEW